MTAADERTAMLRAILTEPEDDAVRLAFADWLDEHGEAARAAFIRVQVATSRLPCGHEHLDEACGGCVVPHLAAREIWRHPEAGTWFGDLLHITIGRSVFDRGGLVNPCGLIRRGFVAEVRLPAAAFLGGPCGDYRGAGRYLGMNADSNPGSCHRCDKGRTPCLARAIFAAHPVEKVILTDKQPLKAEGREQYIWRAQSNPDRADSWELCGDLFDALPLAKASICRPFYIAFDSEPDATDALSAACVSLGRQVAGL